MSKKPALSKNFAKVSEQTNENLNKLADYLEGKVQTAMEEKATAAAKAGAGKVKIDVKDLKVGTGAESFVIEGRIRYTHHLDELDGYQRLMQVAKQGNVCVEVETKGGWTKPKLVATVNYDEPPHKKGLAKAAAWLTMKPL